MNILKSYLSLPVFKVVLMTIALFALMSSAHASSLSLDDSPWGGFGKIVELITGDVAKGVALLGIVGCCGTLIFAGGEMTQFMKQMVYIVLVICILVGAGSFLSLGTNNSASGAVLSEISNIKYVFN